MHHIQNKVGEKMLNLFYITNNLDVALAAERSGVNRIWIDLETLGKEERQGNMNTVKSRHTIRDIENISPKLTNASMLVRINPWNANSEKEIDEVIAAGTDIIMLPYWKTPSEVNDFLAYVNGRCKTILLLETKEAVDCLDTVIKNDYTNEIHIGLNDLRLSYGYDNMFEPYANGLLDKLSEVLNNARIPFGIGGIGQFGLGLSPSPEEFIAEHIRLGSSAVILSRTFCNADKLGDISLIEETLTSNIQILRKTEEWAKTLGEDGLYDIHLHVIKELERQY